MVKGIWQSTGLDSLLLWDLGAFPDSPKASVALGVACRVWRQNRAIGASCLVLGVYLAIAAAIGGGVGWCAHCIPLGGAVALSPCVLRPRGEGQGGMLAQRVGEASHPGPTGLRVETWAVTLQPSTRRPACCKACCVPFLEGEGRVHAAGATTQRYYHPKCISGGLGPKETVEGLGSLPQTQRVAVEAFCDRDGVTRAAFRDSKRRRMEEDGGPRHPLGGEAPSGLHYDADEDWDDGRLRNMAWWDHVGYETGMQEFVPTMGSVPPNLVTAVAEAKRTVLQDARGMESPEAARALKLLFFMDRLIFAQPAGMQNNKTKGKGIDMVVSRRLRRFGRGEWDAMWREATVEGEGRGREKNAESEKTRGEANARRIEKLLKEGEESKAAACVAKAGALAAGSGVLEQLRGLFPCKTQPYSDLHQAESETGPDTEQLWANLSTGIARQIGRIPRLSSPGPSGSRFEHWGVLRHLDGASQDAEEVLASLALGRGPEAAREAFLSGKLVALEKKGGGIRPVACGSTTRRLVAKALCRMFRTDIRQAVGPRQFGVGTSAGTEKMHKVLTVQAPMWETAAVLSFDAANAFNTIRRTKVRERLVETIPGLARACGWWYARATTHVYWDEAHRPHIVTAEEGVDQGCALSPALFAITIAPLLAKLEEVLRQRDDRARVFAYLDDIFVVCDASETMVATNAAAAIMTELGMKLKPEKTKVWSRNPALVLPSGMEQHRVTRMTCLGSTLPFMPRGRGDDEDEETELSRMPVLDGTPPDVH